MSGRAGRPKVFGVGFHKTGTTSLAEALRVLGYRVTGPNGVQDADIATTYLELTRRLSAEYDAFQDNPWPLVYREMDALWPDAKFVLTQRSVEAWTGSMTRHFSERSSPMRELIYGPGHGDPRGHEALYRDTYVAHNEAVRAHFADRPGKLLEVDFSRGGGWGPLCSFLGVTAPEQAFPHANSATDRELSDDGTLGGLVRRARRRLSR